MRKDIIIPEVKAVHIAIVREWNEEFSSHDWNSYLINNTKTPLESCMIMTRGRHKDGRKTSTIRHAFKVVPAATAMKVELVIPEVFGFTNEFILTYFIDGTLYDTVFTAAPNSISEQNYTSLPVMGKEGVMVG